MSLVNQEQQIALLLYEARPSETESPAASLNASSRVVEHALGDGSADSVTVRTMKLYVDFGKFKALNRPPPKALAAPAPPLPPAPPKDDLALIDHDESSAALLWHSHHYGQTSLSGPSGSVASNASVGESSIVVGMKWAESSLTVGFIRHDSHRTIVRRAPNAAAPSGTTLGVSPGVASNVLQLEFDSALSGLPREKSPLYLRELYTDSKGLRSDVFDPKRVFAAPPTQIDVCLVGSNKKLFALKFSDTSKITHDSRINLAAMFATKVLGYLSIVRVMNAAALSLLASKVDRDAKFAELKTKFATWIGKNWHINDETKRAFALGADEAGLWKDVLGNNLYSAVQKTPDLMTNIVDVFGRINNENSIKRQSERNLDGVRRRWRNSVVKALTGKEPDAATDSTPTEIFKKFKELPTSEDRGFLQKLFELTIAFAQYPSELLLTDDDADNATDRADDQKLYRQFQLSLEAGLRKSAKSLVDELTKAYEKCKEQVVEASTMQAVLKQIGISDDEVRSLAILYVVGRLQKYQASAFDAPGGAELAAVVGRLHQCVGKDNVGAAVLASLVAITDLFDKKTSWQKSLFDTAPADDSLLVRIQKNVPSSVEAAVEATLLRGGIALDLSHRLRFELWEAYKTAYNLAVRTHNDVNRMNVDASGVRVEGQELRKRQLGSSKRMLDLVEKAAVILFGDNVKFDRLVDGASATEQFVARVNIDSNSLVTSADNAYLALAIRRALDSIGGRLSDTIDGDDALGGSAAIKFFSQLAARLRRSLSISAALSEHYEKKPVDMRKLNEDLTAFEEDALREQLLENDATLNDALVREIYEQISLATAAVEEIDKDAAASAAATATAAAGVIRPPEIVTTTKANIEGTKRLIGGVSSALGSRDFGQYALRLLGSLRATLQQLAKVEANNSNNNEKQTVVGTKETLFAPNVRAMHLLHAAGYLIRAELLVAQQNVETSSAEQAIQLQSSLRIVESQIGEALLKKLVRLFVDPVRSEDDEVEDVGAIKSGVEEYGALLLRIRTNGGRIDYVPIATVNVLNARFKDAKIVENLAEYKNLQTRYYDDVVAPVQPERSRYENNLLIIEPTLQTSSLKDIVDKIREAILRVGIANNRAQSELQRRLRATQDSGESAERLEAEKDAALAVEKELDAALGKRDYKLITSELETFFRYRSVFRLVPIGENAMRLDKSNSNARVLFHLIDLNRHIDRLFDLMDIETKEKPQNPTIDKLFEQLWSVKEVDLLLQKKYFNIFVPDTLEPRRLKWKPETAQQLARKRKELASAFDD